MHQKTLLKGSLVLATLGGIVLSSYVFYVLRQNPDPPLGDEIRDISAVSVERPLVLPKQEFTKQEPVRFGLPVRFKIPKINVDAAVEYVGLDPDGVMGVPKNRLNVAWFDPGTRPGEVGSAVIAGHYGWKDGKASAFDNIYTLRKGDMVYVEDENGVTVSFVVRESKTYGPNDDASDVFGSRDALSHLNLITCGGVWNNVLKSYSQRIVVFTDRQEARR